MYKRKRIEEQNENNIGNEDGRRKKTRITRADSSIKCAACHKLVYSGVCGPYKSVGRHFLTTCSKRNLWINESYINRSFCGTDYWSFGLSLYCSPSTNAFEWGRLLLSCVSLQWVDGRLEFATSTKMANLKRSLMEYDLRYRYGAKW